jgi:hypothetical protein
MARATGSRITIKGDKEIEKALLQLEPKLAKKVIRQAERKALKIPKALATQNTPVLSGRMKKSIRIRSSKGRRTGQRQIAMAFLIGAGNKKPPGAPKQTKKEHKPWWAFLIEYGWHTRGRKIRDEQGKTIGYLRFKGGRRHIPGKFIMKHALKSTEASVQAVMKEEILAGVEREAKA